ncbi:hypothetical protein GCM10009001_08120 [Virgibacillus siamensis]|uniref:HTH merR-type domain-containing protein n=1 Tax=Virgibacillus siamensis TaxID=480071 RepID=A0ABN1FNC9_9BACI
MRISEFAQLTGISKDTIRYYEKIGLLHPALHNNQRDYTNQDISNVDTIIKLKGTGFSLKEIKILFDWSKDADHERELTVEEIQNLLKIKDLFQVKYEQILQQEEKIKEVKQVLKSADHKIEFLLQKNNGGD